MLEGEGRVGDAEEGAAPDYMHPPVFRRLAPTAARPTGEIFTYLENVECGEPIRRKCAWLVSQREGCILRDEVTKQEERSTENRVERGGGFLACATR